MEKQTNVKSNYNKFRLAAILLCAGLILIVATYYGKTYVGAGTDKSRQLNKQTSITTATKSDLIAISSQSDAQSGTQENTENSMLSDDEKLAIQEQFDEMCTSIYNKDITYSLINLHFSVENPKAMGINDYPISYGDISYDKMREDESERTDILENLSQYDTEALREDQKLTYKVISDYLETEKLSEGFELYYEPLMPTIGIQAQLPIMLAEYEFRSVEDVEEYLTLLQGIDEYYSQIIEFEKLKSEAGLFMSDKSADVVIESCDDFLLSPSGNFMSETFADRLALVPGITEQEKANFISEDQAALENDFAKAYDYIREGITALKGSGKNDMGLSYYPDGDKYCEYLIKSDTGTSYETIDKLREAIVTRLNSDFLKAADVTADKNPSYSFVYSYKFKEEDPEKILNYLSGKIGEAFPKLPDYNYTVKYVPESLETALSPAFYLVPYVDDYYNNIIYINQGEASE